MNEPSQPLSSRAEKARQIAETPGKYKVCVGCDSIVVSKTNICPNCHAYRFDSSPERVIWQANELANKEQSTVAPDDLY